jgi:hypothetical protein
VHDQVVLVPSILSLPDKRCQHSRVQSIGTTCEGFSLGRVTQNSSHCTALRCTNSLCLCLVTLCFYYCCYVTGRRVAPGLFEWQRRTSVCQGSCCVLGLATALQQRAGKVMGSVWGDGLFTEGVSSVALGRKPAGNGKAGQTQEQQESNYAGTR